MSYLKATAFVAAFMIVGTALLTGVFAVALVLANTVGDWAAFTWMIGLPTAGLIWLIAEDM